jgi:hypothetical protein
MTKSNGRDRQPSPLTKSSEDHVEERGKEAEALWYVGPGKAEIRPEEVAAPKAGEVRLTALYSGISRGTERLVFNGRVPESEYARMRAPNMGGSFPFPVKYGYATVARIEMGPEDLVGRIGFVLYPHQTAFNLPADAVTLLPPDVPASRGVLGANMETALNAVWDAAPGPADRIAVVGGGFVGALCAWLRAKLPIELGVGFSLPFDAPVDCDVVFHASATQAGLATALRLAGDEASVIELSWYGAAEVTVPLGQAFHSRRLRLISSQVGQVAPSHRPRWSYRRRLAAALGLLRDDALEVLVARPIDFYELPAALPKILAPSGDVLCPLVRYPAVKAT